MSNDLEKNNILFSDIKSLINETRSAVAQTVNAGLTMLYWNIGKTINDDILKNELEREYYVQMCRVEKWSVRELRKKIDTMTFQRSNISKRPNEIAELALKNLSDNNTLSPDLVFKSPCFGMFQITLKKYLTLCATPFGVDCCV